MIEHGNGWQARLHEGRPCELAEDGDFPWRGIFCFRESSLSMWQRRTELLPSQYDRRRACLLNQRSHVLHAGNYRTLSPANERVIPEFLLLTCYLCFRPNITWLMPSSSTFFPVLRCELLAVWKDSPSRSAPPTSRRAMTVAFRVLIRVLALVRRFPSKDGYWPFPANFYSRWDRCNRTQRSTKDLVSDTKFIHTSLGKRSQCRFRDWLPAWSSMLSTVLGRATAVSSQQGYLPANHDWRQSRLCRLRSLPRRAKERVQG